MRSDAKLQREALESMVRSGMSTREIAEAAGVARSTAFRACQRFGIKLPDRLAQSFAKSAQDIPDSLFVPRLPRDQSWLLGLIATDGNVGSNGRLTISIGDEDGVQQAAAILGMGHIRVIAPRPNTTTPMWSYSTCSRRLADRLAALGITPRKTAALPFPLPSTVSMQDFIRGAWDGDGSWGIDRRDGALRTGFGGASETFVRGLHDVLREVTGSRAAVRRHADIPYWIIQYQGRAAVRLARWLYEHDGPALSRKQLIVQAYL